MVRLRLKPVVSGKRIDVAEKVAVADPDAIDD
jgi:hypothetical protein